MGAFLLAFAISFSALPAGATGTVGMAGAASLTYAITDLGTLGGNFCAGFTGQNSFATAINDSGQVVGGSCAFAGFFERVTHAFLYDGATMHDLGALGPACVVGERDRGCWHSVGRGVNGAGQVVGSSGTSSFEFGSKAFLYTGTAVTSLLPNAASQAFGINGSGQVVGSFSSSPFDPFSSHAFLYSGGVVRDLGTLGGLSSAATAINDGGRVVGQALTVGNSSTHAFIYDGVMHDLGTLGGRHSFAHAVNNFDQVVGHSWTSGDADEHAFLYSLGAMRDLGTLGGTSSVAWGMNDAGQIVGSAQTPSAGRHAFVYSAGLMTDLNQVLPSASGWVLTEATAINRSGQIVGTGTIAGEQHAFLLTPPPDSSPPLIVSHLTPAPNANGWNNSEVQLTWTVSDPETGIASTSCLPETLVAETAAAVRSCDATNGAGFTSSISITIKIDRTAPSVTFTGNAGTYTIDDWVAIDCSVSDALSGIATSSCPGISAPAYTLGAGTHDLAASATDVAGNTTMATTAFSVLATYDSLCNLTLSFESSSQIAGAMCKQLAAAGAAAIRDNPAAKAGALRAYLNLVRAQTNETLTSHDALILAGFAGVLLGDDR